MSNKEGKFTFDTFTRLNSLPMEKLFDFYHLDYILEGRGRNVRCPFPAHGATGKTPSFRWYPNDNSVGCFGCGKGGGPIAFVANMEGCDYKTAAKILAKNFHLTYKELLSASERIIKDSEIRKEKYKADLNISYIAQLLKKLRINSNSLLLKLDEERILDSYLLALLFAEYFEFDTLDSLLTKFPDSGMETFSIYLRSLGFYNLITSYLDTISKYNVRISCFQQQDVLQFLSYRGFNLNDLIGIRYGLIHKAENRKFSERAYFQFNIGKYPVGSLGRSLIPDNNFKYLYENFTGLDKSNIVVGLDLNEIRSIVKLNCIIYVEGFFDYLRLRSLGCTNVVAIQGSSTISKNQLLLGSAFADKIIFCFDGDERGQQANQKGLEIAEELGLKAKVITLPETDDPDTLGKTNSFFMKKLIFDAMTTDF